MIVAPQPEPTEAGADVLREGGNAVDAGIACALVQGVVDPLMCGIAGFGSCGIYMPGKKFHGYIDAHAPAPLGARPDMWANLIESEARDGYGFILKGRLNDIGYKSICAPANLKMYYEAHKEHGSLPWSRIVEPAIAWAESGWTVRPHVHYWWSDDGAFGRAPNHERTGFTPAARTLYCRLDGTPKRVGDRVVNRDYGQTLRAIAKGGADVFYAGEIAQAIAADMKKNEALLSIEDLKAWKPIRNPPLWGDYRGYKVSTNQRPGGAGSIAPGKARFSSVVPSIIFRDGKPHLIIGAPGATQIAMGVLHAVLNALDFDMTMVEAVSAPRFSATSDTIDISNRIQWKVERELQGQGYPVVRSPYTFGFAAVHAIRVHEDGLDGGADPGHDGVVIAV